MGAGGGAWRGGAPSAPSIKASDPGGWLAASAACGAAAGLAALALSWRAAPGLAAPPWPLAEQLGCWAATAIQLAAPDLFAGASRACSAAWARVGASQAAGMWLRYGLAAAAAIAPAPLLWRSFMAPRDALIHVRGSRRLEGKEAAAGFRRATQAEVELGRDHDLSPELPYGEAGYARGLVVVGSPGSGKSTVLKPLIDKIVRAGESLILFDPKSEFTSSWDEPIILAPWDARSWAWDIARDMRNVGDLRRFAAAAIHESHDPMWSSASRQVIVGIGMHLNATRGDAWGWREMADWVSAPQAQLAEMLRESYPEGARAFEKATVTSTGILINLTAHCASIFDLARAWGDAPRERRFSVGDWARQKGPRQIIMQGHRTYAELTKACCGGVIETLAGLVASPEMDDSRRKLWIICDEFPQLGEVGEGIAALMETGRSRGVRVCLAFQNINQVNKIYGDDGASSLLAMAGLALIGRTRQSDGAEKLCQLIGAREVERPNQSWSAGSPGASTLSFAREELALYKPSELYSRLGPTSDGKGAVFCALLGDAHEVLFPRFELHAKRAAMVPAPWTVKARRRSVEPEERAAVDAVDPELVGDLGGDLDAEADRAEAGAARRAWTS